MYEPWIFATTLAAGGGLVAYSVALQPQQNDNPIYPEPPAAAVHVIPPAPPARIAEPAPADTVLELAPVIIQARLHRATAAPQTDNTEVKDEAVQHPCSDWRDLGPTHVAVSATPGAVAVRSLCP